MSDSSGPIPQRIGDAERDRAAEYLREHVAVGRLDPVEFDERLTRALNAKTSTELDLLFTDLPGPKPGTEMVPTSFTAPPWQRPSSPTTTPVGVAGANVPQKKPTQNQIWARVSAVAWPLAIFACIVTNWDYWWIILLPVFVPWIIGALTGQDGTDKGHGKRH